MSEALIIRDTEPRYADHGAWLGGSEMALRVRAFDWSTTSVGPLAGWPAGLRVAAATCLHSGFAMAVYWGPELNLLYNDAFRHVLGKLHPDALGLPARLHLEDTPDVLARLRSVVSTGEGTWTEDELLLFEHSGAPVIRFSTYSYSPITDADGAGVPGVMLVCQDTTARVTSHRRAVLLGRLASRSIGAESEGEVCLRTAETLEGSLDIPLVMIFLCDPDGANATCAAVSDATVRRRRPRHSVPLHDSADPAASIVLGLAEDGAPGRIATVGPFCVGDVPVADLDRAWVAPLRHAPDGPLTGFVVAEVNGRLALDAPYRAFLEIVTSQLNRAVVMAQARDVDRRSRREPKLHALLDELRAAQRRIAAAGDAERRRIERDLHDGAQQRLVALQLELSLVEEQLDRDPAAARTQLGRLRGDLDDALTELRELAHGLYPVVLESEGLVAAVSAAARRSPIAVSVTADAVETLPRGVAVAAYFCCLEALQNVVKHAGDAAQATVRLEVADGALRFWVEDDGVGFDPAGVTPGHGLVNLRDRLAALGGTAEVRATPGHGTSVTGCLPLG